MECIHCGVQVHPKRVEILLSKGTTVITCIEHSTAERVVGFQVNEAKMGHIEVCTPAQGKRLMSLQRKGGGATGGPGVNNKGVVYKG